MKQNEVNSQKAQELTKEELEQINGGKGYLGNPTPQGGYVK
jgi:bacteriocin-like protein